MGLGLGNYTGLLIYSKSFPVIHFHFQGIDFLGEINDRVALLRLRGACGQENGRSLRKPIQQLSCQVQKRRSRSNLNAQQGGIVLVSVLQYVL